MLHGGVAGPADVLEADGYVFAAPENLGSLAGVMKDFFDRCYYPVLDRVAGRPYAAMVCAGSDGHNAVRQMQRITTGWRLKPVAERLHTRMRMVRPTILLTVEWRRACCH